MSGRETDPAEMVLEILLESLKILAALLACVDFVYWVITGVPPWQIL